MSQATTDPPDPATMFNAVAQELFNQALPPSPAAAPEPEPALPTLFSREGSKGQLLSLFKKGEEQQQRYWDFGYPLLSEKFPSLRSGLWLIFAPENVGKSVVTVNLGVSTLKSMADCYWLDISLDDADEDRLGYVLARHANLPIDLIKQSANAEVDARKARKQAFTSFLNQYGDRYRLVGLSNEELENADPDAPECLWTAQRIRDEILACRREIGPDAKLLVTIDGFHDVEWDGYAEDENSRQGKKAKCLKQAAIKANALVIATAHQIKHTRNRQVTTDDLFGGASLKYHARLICHVYSDLNENRETAVVVWQDPTQPAAGKLPVLELNVLKNKAGRFKGILFYQFSPDQAVIAECPPDYQALYRSYVFGSQPAAGAGGTGGAGGKK